MSQISMRVAYGSQQKANVYGSRGVTARTKLADDQINNPENGLISKQGKTLFGQSDVVMKNMQKRGSSIIRLNS